MAEYEAIKADAKKWDIRVYPYTKKWFLGEFDPDKNGFDMAKAKQEITEYRMFRAILNAPSSAVNQTAELAVAGD